VGVPLGAISRGVTRIRTGRSIGFAPGFRAPSGATLIVEIAPAAVRRGEELEGRQVDPWRRPARSGPAPGVAGSAGHAPTFELAAGGNGTCFFDNVVIRGTRGPSIPALELPGLLALAILLAGIAVLALWWMRR
jgi:hypothetical protein